MKRLYEALTRRASSRHGSPWRAAGILLVVLLAVAGTGMLVLAQNVEPVRLQPPAPAAPAAAPTSPRQTAPGTVRAVGMARSEPTEISIPRIGLEAKIVTVGLDAAGAIQVPPLEQAHLAGWYRLGPSPGEVGNAVVVGHVDSYAMGPAVFFEIGTLRAGDVIEIRRKDATVARFVVKSTGSYPKSAFPTDLVYGPSDQAGLRLITCGGQFDEAARSYLNNVIVFATLSP
jgi:Sortase domain